MPGDNWQQGDPDRRAVTQLPTTEVQELKQAFKEFTAELQSIRREVAQDIKEATTYAEARFLSKETFVEVRTRWDMEFKDVHKDIDAINDQRTEDNRWRKSMNLTVLLAVASNFISITVAIIGFLKK